jgi:glycine oxidase
VELRVQLNTQQHLSDVEIQETAITYDWQIDCRGLAASNALKDLRGVKGEMLHIYSTEVELNRPIRLLHPRYPLYIVPRPNHQFMVGATMIEANNGRNPTVRSVLELLSAAYAVHPAFGEAEIVEIGVDTRPAFNDNLPKIRRYGNQVYVNGLYRHGYLGAPALARRVVDLLINGTPCAEVVDANYPEWPDHRNATNVA